MAKSVRELQKVLGQAAKDDPRNHWLPYYCYANRKEDFKYLYHKVILERLVRAEVARRSGNKRQSRKWKSMNPKIWEQKYGLIDVAETYYQRRKHLYASLFEHPINVVA